jgi:hypothetical protein
MYSEVCGPEGGGGGGGQSNADATSPPPYFQADSLKVHKHEIFFLTFFAETETL